MTVGAVTAVGVPQHQIARPRTVRTARPAWPARRRARSRQRPPAAPRASRQAETRCPPTPQARPGPPRSAPRRRPATAAAATITRPNAVDSARSARSPSSAVPHRAPVIGHQLHRLIQRLSTSRHATTSTPTVPMSRYMNDRCSDHIRAISGSRSVLERRALQHVDGDDGVAALAQVDQRQRELGVEQRGERDDDRARRHRRARRQRARCGLEAVATRRAPRRAPGRTACGRCRRRASAGGGPRARRRRPGHRCAARSARPVRRRARSGRWPPSPGPRGCGYLSTSTTTSAARSVSRSVTCRLPRRALTGQLTVRS